LRHRGACTARQRVCCSVGAASLTISRSQSGLLAASSTNLGAVGTQLPEAVEPDFCPAVLGGATSDSTWRRTSWPAGFGAGANGSSTKGAPFYTFLNNLPESSRAEGVRRCRTGRSPRSRGRRASHLGLVPVTLPVRWARTAGPVCESENPTTSKKRRDSPPSSVYRASQGQPWLYGWIETASPRLPFRGAARLARRASCDPGRAPVLSLLRNGAHSPPRQKLDPLICPFLLA